MPDQSQPKSFTDLVQSVRPDLDDEAVEELLNDDEASEELRDIYGAGLTDESKDRLHAWIVRYLGVSMPRVAVCTDVGHTSPFDAFARLFFCEVDNVLWVANRFGAKSHNGALWILLSSIVFPGCESVSLGAIGRQATQVFKNFKRLRKKAEAAGVREAAVVPNRDLQQQTEFRNGSEVAVVTSSEKAVNGPHPNHCHRDEIDLMAPGILSESMSMTYGAPGIPGQDLYTSTRKKPHGTVAKMEEEAREAAQRGEESPLAVECWCIWETLAPVSNCMHDPANAERPASELCACSRVTKGTNADGSPRRFSDECAGKAAKGDGWVPLEDAWRQFRGNNRATWDAQHTCREADRSLLVYPMFSRDRHCIRNFPFDPANGSVICGTDFGFENPACNLWIQRLKREVEVTMADGSTRVLMPYTRVVFSQIYIAGKTSEWLAGAVMDRERAWREHFSMPNWKVWLRFGDAAAKDARGIFAQRGLQMRRYGTRDLGRSIGYVAEAIEDEQIFIDLSCRFLIEEMEAYSYPEEQAGRKDRGAPVKDFDHSLDALRYAITGLRFVERENAKHGGPVNPAHAEHISVAGTRGRTAASASGWRSAGSGFGGDVTWQSIREEMDRR